MTFTKITASGIGSTETVTLDGLSVINDGSFGGNVSVGGTLTYEDVTNIDSVGLITARAGVVVGSGITLSKDGDIFATGVTTSTTFSGAFTGSGANLTNLPAGQLTGALPALDGSALTGVASTENIRTNTNATFLQNINVSGTTTTAGITNTIASGNVIALMDSSNDAQNHRVRINSQGSSSTTALVISNSDQNNQTSFVHENASALSIRNSQTAGSEPTSGTERLRVEPKGNIKIVNNLNVVGTVTATSYAGDGSSLTGISAISNAQQFRLAADQAGSGSAGTVFTNWEECDTDYQAIGSNWSQSSGVFSCSATGIYVCHWSLIINNTNTGDAFDPNIQISTNSGGAYTTRSRGWSHIANSYVNRTSITNQFLFDVSNTSTFRLRYRQSQDNDLASGTTVAGSSTETLTNIMFIRLGNT